MNRTSTSRRRRMPAADVAWLHMDRRTNLMVVNVVLTFGSGVDWSRVKDLCRERLVERYPPFSQRVVEPRLAWGPVGWEDDPYFDLERHVHRLALRSPGDQAVLLDLVADLMATPLDHSRPLWDMYLVDGYGPGCAIVARVHHCIADGIALSRAMLSLTDDTPDGAASSAPHSAKGPVPGSPNVAPHWRELGSLMRAADTFTRAVIQRPLPGSDTKTVLKGELGVAQRVGTTRPIRLAQVRRTAHAADATVNDVMLSAVTGALSGYLRERGTPVAEIHASVPINLRPLDEPIPPEMGNKFGLALLTLPLGLHDPHERLVDIHRRMAKIKHSPEGAVSYGTLRVAGMMPLNIERIFTDVSTARASAVITNVPGPPHPVYLAGTPVREMLAWAPKPGSLSMCVTIFSYNGEITVTLAVDAGLIPDPQRILARVEDELAELQERLDV
jgi:diacylglycerol O-acyltransferase